MNAFIRKAVVGTLMLSGAMGAHAATFDLAIGPLTAGTTSITFQALSGGSKSFGVLLNDGPQQFAPLTLELYQGATMVSGLLTKTAGGASLTGTSIVPGVTYTLSFSSASSGSFKATTSLASFSVPTVTQVPEAGSVAMALAGLGVLGLLRRRRLS
jgi:MYXO-CTERM domain-containing protein